MASKLRVFSFPVTIDIGYIETEVKVGEVTRDIKITVEDLAELISENLLSCEIEELIEKIYKKGTNYEMLIEKLSSLAHSSPFYKERIIDFLKIERII